MHVCAHTHTFTCMYICTYMHSPACTYAHTHSPVCMYTRAHTHKFTCMHICTHTLSPVCTYACTRIDLHIHTHTHSPACTYTYMCVHTHTHIPQRLLHHRHRKLKDIAAPVEGTSHVCSLWKEQNRGRTSPQRATKPVTWDPLQVHSDMTPYLASCLVPDDYLLGRHPFTSVDAGTRLWQDLVTESGEPQTPWQPQNKFLKLEIISLYFILESSIIWVFSIDTIGNIKEAEAGNTRGIQKLWLNKTACNSRCQRSKLKS